jgi:hypothetical protein
MLLSCAIKGEGWLDIHFKWARYRKEYIKEHFSEKFEDDLKYRQTAVEALVPAVFYPRDSKDILRASDLAVCRLNLQKVDFVC